jgi:hypothetical protein
MNGLDKAIIIPNNDFDIWADKGTQAPKSTDYRLFNPWDRAITARIALRLQVSAKINFQEKIAWRKKIYCGSRDAAACVAQAMNVWGKMPIQKTTINVINRAMT